MSYYWAKYEKIGKNSFRYDTRVYLKEIEKPLDSDICIGAVVGKNPGSAIQSKTEENSYSKINLNGDKLLPTVKNIISKSCDEIKDNQYIQVLNLFYLCEKDLKKAIEKNSLLKNPKICESETKEFP